MSIFFIVCVCVCAIGRSTYFEVLGDLTSNAWEKKSSNILNKIKLYLD